MDEYFTKIRFDPAVYVQPPSWTRLEPQSITGDPTPGLEARVHDPLWLIGRQWQLGELQGDDAGSPIGVEIAADSVLLSRWQAGRWDEPDAAAVKPAQDLPDGTLLEPLVEDEVAGDPGLRARVDAGSLFLAQLDDAGLSALRDHVVAECALHDAGDQPLDVAWNAVSVVLGGRAVDGRLLAHALDAATAAGLALPAWLDPPDPAVHAALVELATGWREWYASDVEPPADPATDAWVADRLEYGFSVAAGTSGGEVVLHAPEFAGGAVDWYSFDLDPDPVATLGAAQIAGQRKVRRVLQPSPLRFAGMPADRLWELEDARVNLGALQTEPHDLARLMLVEFALSFGTDWLVVPLDVPFGSLTSVDWITYTTTFGERFAVEPPRSTRPHDPWRMFSITTPDGDRSLDALFVPPACAGLVEGPPLEDVIFLRDEIANLAWAVERTVQGPSGDPRTRADERTGPRRRDPGQVSAAELDYELQAGVPEHWIPYLPTTDGYAAIALVQGALLRFEARAGEPPPPPDGQPVAPLGRILTEPGAGRIADAEVPREGVRVRRLRVLARGADGAYHRWTGRRAGTGSGEGSSGLAFDGATARKPKQP